MFETHERILQKLAESGQKEFSAQMIHNIIDDVESEIVDRMYDQWRMETDPYASHDADLELVSWDDAAEDLTGFPELKDNHDMGMER